MLHWKNQIQIIHQEKTNNLSNTLQFYQEKIDQLKQNFPMMFEDNRKFKIENGWKIFEKPSHLQDD